MTNLALVSRKLATLEDHLQRLRQRRPEAIAFFQSDLLLQDAIAMGILVVVREAMGIALHIASDEGWPLASTYREAFTVLEQHGVIDTSLAASLAVTAQLRNRIAHGYGTVDAGRIWNTTSGWVPSAFSVGRSSAVPAGPSHETPVKLAESKGFEPLVAFTTPDFESRWA